VFVVEPKEIKNLSDLLGAFSYILYGLVVSPQFVCETFFVEYWSSTYILRAPVGE